MKAHTCVCHDGEQPGFSVSPGPQVNASNPMNHKTLGRTKKATLREARAIGHWESTIRTKSSDRGKITNSKQDSLTYSGFDRLTIAWRQ